MCQWKNEPVNIMSSISTSFLNRMMCCYLRPLSLYIYMSSQTVRFLHLSPFHRRFRSDFSRFIQYLLLIQCHMIKKFMTALWPTQSLSSVKISTSQKCSETSAFSNHIFFLLKSFSFTERLVMSHIRRLWCSLCFCFPF